MRSLSRSQRLWGPVYALPAVALVIAFIGYPLGSIIYHAFTQWSGLSPPEWIGLDNFRALVHDPVFWRALRNNALFALSVPIQVVGALILAYLIYQRLPGWRLFRSTFFLPAILSTVVVGILASLVLQLDGPLNDALGAVGLDFLQRNWLAAASSAIPMIILVVVWANFGYSVLLYLAGMSSLSPELIEAARLDGAGPWRILWSVIVPNLKRVVELVLVINTITAFAYMFTYIYVITSGGPGFETYSTEFYIYDTGFVSQSLGYASAIGVALTLIIAMLGLFQIRILAGRQA